MIWNGYSSLSTGTGQGDRSVTCPVMVQLSHQNIKLLINNWLNRGKAPGGPGVIHVIPKT
jgi:hypothetical protein